jgi:hypothetical protein
MFQSFNKNNNLKLNICFSSISYSNTAGIGINQNLQTNSALTIRQILLRLHDDIFYRVKINSNPYWYIVYNLYVIPLFYRDFNEQVNKCSNNIPFYKL